MNNDALRRQIIADYFKSWTTGDVSRWREWFAEDIRYEESVGTGYKGIEQMLRWQNDWKDHGTVFSWNICEVYPSNNTYTVLWSFHCVYDGNESEFNGVSVIDFNNENKITLLREFAADPNIVYPYKD